MMGELIVRERLSSAAREEMGEDELGVPPRGGGRRGGGGGFRHRHHHHHHGLGPRFRRESFITPAVLYYGMPVEEEVAGHVQANECFVVQWGADPTGVRPAVISALKARGWVERVDVRPRGSFNVKVRLLCPPPAEAVQPQSVPPQPVAGLQPSLMRVDYDRREMGDDEGDNLGWISGLGQLNPQLRVLVTDRRGEPASDIEVTVQPSPGTIHKGMTDSDGVFIAPLNPNSTNALVTAKLPEGDAAQMIGLAQGYANTVIFRSIRKVNGPIVTPLELGAGLGGIILFLLGHFVWKSEPVKMVGEIGFIAAVFTRVGRA